MKVTKTSIAEDQKERSKSEVNSKTKKLNLVIGQAFSHSKAMKWSFKNNPNS